MSALLLIVLVGVAVVLTVRSARRGLSDRHAVEEHHRTLDTLGEIAQRHDAGNRLPDQPGRVAPPPAQPHIRVVPPGGATRPTGPGQPAPWPQLEQPSPDRWPAPASEEIHVPVPPIPPIPPVVPLAHDLEALPVHPLGKETPPLSAPITPPPRPPSRPLPVPPEPAAPLVALTVEGGKVLPADPPRRRRRGVIAAVSAAATILVVLGAATIIATLAHSGGRHARPPVAAPQPTFTPSTTPPTASAVLIDSNSQGARYSVAPAASSIVLVPTSNCWVQVRTGDAKGPVVFQGTMHAGDRMPLPTSGPVWLRLGNPPGISIVVNGTPLHLVTPSVAQPYNLEFQPAG